MLTVICIGSLEGLVITIRPRALVVGYKSAARNNRVFRVPMLVACHRSLDLRRRI